MISVVVGTDTIPSSHALFAHQSRTGPEECARAMSTRLASEASLPHDRSADGRLVVLTTTTGLRRVEGAHGDVAQFGRGWTLKPSELRVRIPSSPPL